jgi:hypothetical protein
MGAAWEQHGMCELAFTTPEKGPATQTEIAVTKYRRVVHLTAGSKQLFTFLCTVRAGDRIFLMENETKIIDWELEVSYTTE